MRGDDVTQAMLLGDAYLNERNKTARIMPATARFIYLFTAPSLLCRSTLRQCS